MSNASVLKIIFTIALISASSVHLDSARAASTWQLSISDGGEVRALVIGIDDYQHVRKLKGATADAHDIDLKFENDGCSDVTALINDRADRPNVLREISALVEVPRPTISSFCRLPTWSSRARAHQGSQARWHGGTSSCCPGFEVHTEGSQQRILGSEFIIYQGSSSYAEPRLFSLRIHVMRRHGAWTSIHVPRK
jgi:hypothetical protein